MCIMIFLSEKKNNFWLYTDLWHILRHALRRARPNNSGDVDLIAALRERLRSALHKQPLRNSDVQLLEKGLYGNLTLSSLPSSPHKVLCFYLPAYKWDSEPTTADLCPLVYLNCLKVHVLSWSPFWPHSCKCSRIHLLLGNWPVYNLFMPLNNKVFHNSLHS